MSEDNTVRWVNADLARDMFNAAAAHGLASSDLLVMLTINTFVNRVTMQCLASITKIARRSRLDVKAVRKAIMRLSDAGLIEIEVRQGRPSVMTLTIPETPTASGGTRSGRGTTSGTTRSPGDPYPIREGTPTRSGTRTSRDKEREGARSRNDDVPAWVHHSLWSVEEYLERKDDAGWVEMAERVARERIGAAS